MYSAVVNDGVGDFHIFTMLVILLHFVWWKVAADPHFGLAWPLFIEAVYDDVVRVVGDR